MSKVGPRLIICPFNFQKVTEWLLDRSLRGLLRFLRLDSFLRHEPSDVALLRCYLLSKLCQWVGLRAEGGLLTANAGTLRTCRTRCQCDRGCFFIRKASTACISSSVRINNRSSRNAGGRLFFPSRLRPESKVLSQHLRHNCLRTCLSASPATAPPLLTATFREA